MLHIFQLWFEKNTVSAAEINYVGANFNVSPYIFQFNN